MRPNEWSCNLREVTDVLKFLYCLTCFGLSLRKFDEIISSSHQGRAEFVLDIHGSTSVDPKNLLANVFKKADAFPSIGRSQTDF